MASDPPQCSDLAAGAPIWCLFAFDEIAASLAVSPVFGDVLMYWGHLESTRFD